MGVVYIGDRAVGKTALALELIKPESHYVRVSNQDYEKIKVNLIEVATGKLLATKVNPATVYDNRNLKVEVDLPAGHNSISVDWIDTPGEIWQSSWQRDPDNAKKWGQVVTTVQQSEGVMLILPPYREMPGLKPDVDMQEFPTQQQWCNRFNRWVDFFRDDCRRARHIVLCLNKADLFCDLEEEAYELAYQQYGSRKNWFQRNAYVTQKYFQPIQSQITEITKKTSGVPVRFNIQAINDDAIELQTKAENLIRSGISLSPTNVVNTFQLPSYSFQIEIKQKSINLVVKDYAGEIFDSLNSSIMDKNKEEYWEEYFRKDQQGCLLLLVNWQKINDREYSQKITSLIKLIDYHQRNKDFRIAVAMLTDRHKWLESRTGEESGQEA